MPDGATYTLRLSVDVPEGIRGKASCSHQQASPKNDFQTMRQKVLS